jgi:hypothetical protein
MVTGPAGCFGAQPAALAIKMMAKANIMNERIAFIFSLLLFFGDGSK